MLPKFQITSARQLLITPLIVLILTTNACSWTPQVRTPLYEGTEGSVSLVTELSTHFHPSHPVDLSPQTIEQVLRGLHLQQQTGLLQKLLSGTPAKQRVFSDGQITWLTPILAQAFSQVTQEEQVLFQVANPQSSDLGAIKGTMFVEGQTLVVSLNWKTYGTLPSSRKNQGPASSNWGDISNQILVFVPERAVKKNSAASWLAGTDDSNLVIIDYTAFSDDPSQSDQPLTRVNPQEEAVDTEERPLVPATTGPGISNSSTPPLSSPPSPQRLVEPNHQPGYPDLLEEIQTLKQKLETQQAEIEELKKK